MDFKVSEAIAEGLNLPLKTVWFENELGEENDPVQEIYALLAYGLCDMAPSHPLYVPAIGASIAETGPLPRWLGMPETIDAETQRSVAAHLPHVQLEPITVTQPYMRAEIGLVYTTDTQEPKGLNSLMGRKVAYQQNTMSGAILLVNAPDIAAVAQTFNPGPRFLWNLETGIADVAIVDVAAYDSHKKHNQISTLELANWRHPIGMDIGIALLERNSVLAAAIDSQINQLHEANAFADFARHEGVTYKKPGFAGPQRSLTLQSLLSAGDQ
ncbi:hypothetical protein [Roseobacter sp.]|uniref:hypothetical protein n=1 Tax=Roseobacter sp. TaxID=1907202 RepID=UPI00385F6360